MTTFSIRTSIIFIFVLFFPIIAHTIPLSARTSTPICPRDTPNRIELSSDPRGYVCLSDDANNMLQYRLSDYRSQVKSGNDIRDILRSIREEREGSLNTPDPAVGLAYNIMLDRIKSYATSYCSMYTQTPRINITGENIYSGATLTPTCQIKPYTRSNPAYLLDISMRIGTQVFVGSGGTFSGVMIASSYTGSHEITCSYRPMSCIDPIVSKKVIKVTSVNPIPKNSQSIARQWNEVMLAAIRKDQVRPPVQARNLHHFGAMIYDIWRLSYTDNRAYLFGTDRLRACQIPASLTKTPLTSSDINTAISYAAYRLILARYHESPGYSDTVDRAKNLMNQYGYDTNITSSSMRSDTRASTIGNAAANCYLTYGRSDGSNEAGKTEVDGEVGSYSNQYYKPLNPDLDPNSIGNPNIIDMNRWQPIALQNFIDQGGNPVSGGAAKFIGAEWGNVTPFALRPDQKTTHTRDGHEYHAYLDPGLPPQSVSGEAGVALATPTDKIIPKKDTKIDNSLYTWNYALVGIWSSHLDPRDGVMIDISPASLGNIAPLPTTFEAMRDYYDLKNGGVKTTGRIINPKTGLPYQKELVPRGDYTRAIAEFWADGPNSETPPGHWFTILNEVSDRISQKRIGGTGEIVDDLEWDVKSYFALGGALHDAGIAAWGIKGSYDEVRPVSAIRAMASHGQSSDPTLPSYDIQGLPLISGAIELIRAGDPLEGKTGQNIGKVKMRAWKGPKYIVSPEVDLAGSDWILAESWWPYQRPSFVTPPFAGYVSGHSTFSHAAAELLTELTGDPYFPGGLHETPLRANRYLVFEQGPSRDITLQWATYLDAANESSLSRIWGGIHPPMDDIPGRRIGIQIGTQAYTLARSYFGGK